MALFQSVTDFLGITEFEEQRRQMELAQQQFAGLEAPDIVPLELQRLISSGELTPELAEILKLEANAYKDIYVDPRLKAQQMETLAGLEELAESGMTAEDRADLARIASEEAQAERGAREAILQQAQQRGLSGSGLELAQQLIGQQAGATRRSARDVEVAGQAAQRRIAALEQAGQMAGQIRGQEYGEQADIARAQQAIEQFNIQNTQQQLASRAAAQTAAQQYNLQKAQDIMEKNAALANQEALYRAQAPSQQFQQRLNLAGARAGGYQGLSNIYGQQSQAGLQATTGAAAAAAAAFSDERCKEDIKLAPEEIDNFLEDLSQYSLGNEEAIAGMSNLPDLGSPMTTEQSGNMGGLLKLAAAFSDENTKKDVKLGPEEIDKFLEDLTGYSFRYKNPEAGIGTPGKKIGVMAQDLEESLPQAVEEQRIGDENIKMLNNNEILPAVLASVGRLNDRLNKVEDENE